MQWGIGLHPIGETPGGGTSPFIGGNGAAVGVWAAESATPARIAERAEKIVHPHHRKHGWQDLRSSDFRTHIVAGAERLRRPTETAADA